jgi:hypothetical protein
MKGVVSDRVHQGREGREGRCPSRQALQVRPGTKGLNNGASAASGSSSQPHRHEYELRYASNSVGALLVVLDEELS